ncbi:uncharacterized protein NDAI_0B01905 [Naumovozyma dairenensis CBS 421]|uniref:Uncharacterized protein n=1 Tax=Naumovozyma dairenensis (strain ATCC 10597 / BCRC 20456 / CBS 421 / NBRC 0211 / NRRL Y-12639) TaxID=1071378 RepID=G0W614_NAUDC|nr:hypothetical protein NDAI_0B01905 [Naumovozyma dairenensis CBS 421]CCD23225.1 hypothetical protein NDAI_0B01905 [Naumovozyma dairenensis CBS 421]
MPLLQPNSTECYRLELPELPPNVNLDEATKNRLSLNARTGAAVTLARSSIYVHGGLTIPLNISEINSATLQKELILYFSKSKDSSQSFKNLNDWISCEVFYLDLITRTWERIETNATTALARTSSSQFSERLFHSICVNENALYIFGGLAISPQNDYELIATNELWKLDLYTRKWTLLSKDPRITRRFNHDMFVKYAADDSHDTRLLIVGGLNNMDQPLCTIDVYNLITNEWESISNSNIIKKFDEQPVSIVHNKNLPILIENNEAEVPTLTFYHTNSNDNNDSTEEEEEQLQGEENNYGNSSIKIENELSPIIALPLLPQSQCVRIASEYLQDKDLLKVPYNLQHPKGAYFNRNLLISGFYPNCQASNFYVYIYDISIGKWIQLKASCETCSSSQHRFWNLFVWQSHHQALLLGTMQDDYNLPSVQRFDLITSFSLPIVNSFNNFNNKASTELFQTSFLPSLASDLGSIPTTPIDKRTPPLTTSNSTSKITSQFENYIRYITTPLELKSTSSVFPPSAMVVGKDALEIFGNTLADFEFITSEGDSIAVSAYLLRKRWGRYFSFILSNGYAKVCQEYHSTGNQSTLVKIAPSDVSYTDDGSKLNPPPAMTSSNVSLERYFKNNGNNHNSNGNNHTNTLDNNYHRKKHDTTTNRHHEHIPSTSPRGSNVAVPREHTLASMRRSPCNSRYNLHNSPELDFEPIPSNTNLYDDFETTSSKTVNSKTINDSVTSSSTGMIFRVPFQENDKEDILTTTNNINSNTINYNNNNKNLKKKLRAGSATENNNFINVPKKRRSSVVTNPMGSLNKLSPHMEDAKSRRASNPIQPLTEITQISPPPSRRFSLRFTHSGANSRKASVTSQTSSISFVSSTSDRLNNAILTRRNTETVISSNDPLKSGVLNIFLPPQKRLPSVSLPPVPSGQEPLGPFKSRTNSYIEHFHSDRSSPLSSRRSSFLRSSSVPEVRRKSMAALDKKQSRNGSFSSNGSNSHTKKSWSSASNHSDSGSEFSAGQVELEPLLMPRSLYMPWPTATVKAFTEFFYTGQVNGKWMLAPVTLDLLLISKMYEVPLLYDLITEVLYAIIGKKEGNLFVNCNNLDDSFKSTVKKYFNYDEAEVENYLDTHATYKDLKNLKNLLELTDSGMLDVNLIRKISRNFSFSSFESDSIPSTPRTTKHVVSTVYAGGPRDSHNSVGSIVFPSTNVNITSNKRSVSLYTPRMKGKSSLSKEIDPTISEKARNKSTDNLTSKSKSSSKHFDSTLLDLDERDPVLVEQLDQARLQDLSRIETDYPLNSEDTLRTGSTGNIISHTLSDSSQSDSDDFESQIGLLSISRMKKHIREVEIFEDAIDPLHKINNALQSPSKSFDIISSKPSITPLNRALKNDLNSNNNNSNIDFESPTLESMISPNSLPPVDYVMKIIYRTSVLVNDTRLMLRCIDCIEISRKLKIIRKLLTQDINRMNEDVLKRSSEQDKSKRGKPELTIPISSNGTRDTMTSFKIKPYSPTATTFRRSSSKAQISPRTSIPNDMANKTISGRKSSTPQQQRILTKSTGSGRFSNISAIVSTPSSLNTAVIARPPLLGTNSNSSSSVPPKSKKDSNASTSSSFSFFGIRK